MSDTQKPQGDKARKPRPFGNFLLFLTVLVIVLVAFGGANLGGPEDLTQDQFLVKLYTGEIESLKTKGEFGVEGTERGGKTIYRTSFANVAAIEESLAAVNAVGRYLQISEADLRLAITERHFQPELHRHLTMHKRERTMEGTQVTGRFSQEDLLYVRGTAQAGSKWMNASLPDLPHSAGKVWFKVQFDDLGDLKTTLVANGSIAENLEFDISDKTGTVHSQADASFGLILLTWGPWILIFGVFLLFLRQMRNQGSGAGVMSFGRSRAQRYVKEDNTHVTFDDVAGAQEAKDEVSEVVEFLKNPGRFTRIGGRIPRGVLLVGPPGCGKTLLAKAIAGEAEVPFFSISGSDFVEMFVGVGASRVRDLFKQARETSPCIIFLDEIDAVGRRRGSGMGGGHDEREQTLNAILVEMDGFGTDDGIIVVAATNRPDVLDPALLRPGRFDREVTIDLPDMHGREAILRIHLKKVKLSDDVDAVALARSTPGYSGADLAAIVNEAAIMAVLDDKEVIEMPHLEEAAAKVRFGRRKTSLKMEEEDLRITAYHEAGHTIVASKILEVDIPHKVTIVPRGRALGATMMFPEKESYHMQQRRLLGQIATAFGGRVAEDIFVGDISAGAADDIRRATELARAMVSELGMSKLVGPINYAERHGSDFLGAELLGGKWHSEATAHVIDKEIERILREAYDRAYQIVEDEREAVERLAKALLLYETLDSEEIKSLIEKGTRPEDLRPEQEDTKPVSEPTETALATPEASSDTVPDGEQLGGLAGEAGLSPA